HFLHPPLPSFPIRRSSDLSSLPSAWQTPGCLVPVPFVPALRSHEQQARENNRADDSPARKRQASHVPGCSASGSVEGEPTPCNLDRKSTRLNSSHWLISYA